MELETLEVSFSAVSTPIFASDYSDFYNPEQIANIIPKSLIFRYTILFQSNFVGIAGQSIYASARLLPEINELSRNSQTFVQTIWNFCEIETTHLNKFGQLNLRGIIEIQFSFILLSHCLDHERVTCSLCIWVLCTTHSGSRDLDEDTARKKRDEKI